ncbi:hypothetical protein mvi_514 [Megavirus vitis]|uniref:Uncharacterized protein n=2 Tax=unclassified Megavirus TaxID=3068396 RepID=A0A2K9V8F1_9VIRU|nr:hypothetical protein c7_L649 [Megavirus courdo7]AUV58495.1 hypothetical protein [Bandra megavirus]AVL93874.1 hypothetical protein mvi_514 [Megavirus vitis]
MANFNYYDYRISTVTNDIKKELEFYLKSDFANQYPLDQYIFDLKKRIGCDRYESSKTYYDNSQTEMKKMNLDEYGKDMDAMVYKKPWNKLKEFHKIMKIKEYINKLTYVKKITNSDMENNKESLIKEIILGLKSKKFNKNKSEIIYDYEKMEITSMSCLDYNKKKGIYVIDWDA